MSDLSTADFKTIVKAYHRKRQQMSDMRDADKQVLIEACNLKTVLDKARDKIEAKNCLIDDLKNEIFVMEDREVEPLYKELKELTGCDCFALDLECMGHEDYEDRQARFTE